MTKRPPAGVTYTDENGNPIDPTALDSSNVEFTDEFGRPCDAEGNLLNGPLSPEQALEIGESLLQAGEYAELSKHCEQCLAADPQSAGIWNLLAIACINQNDPLGARQGFLSALLASPGDPLVLSNYFTVCLQQGDKDAAISGIREFFPGLDAEAKSVVLQSIREAIRLQLIQAEDLPEGVSS